MLNEDIFVFVIPVDAPSKNCFSPVQHVQLLKRCHLQQTPQNFLQVVSTIKIDAV